MKDDNGLTTNLTKCNSIVAAVLDVSLVEQINRALDMWYVAIEIWNLFFSTCIKKEDQKQLNSQGTDNNTHLLSLLGVMLNFLSHNIFQWGMDHLYILQNIIAVHYIVEEEVATMNSLVKHVCPRGWEINLTNI